MLQLLDEDLARGDDRQRRLSLPDAVDVARDIDVNALPSAAHVSEAVQMHGAAVDAFATGLVFATFQLLLDKQRLASYEKRVALNRHDESLRLPMASSAQKEHKHVIQPSTAAYVDAFEEDLGELVADDEPEGTEDRQKKRRRF